MLQGANMPRARRWLGAIRRIFAKSSCKTIAVLDHTNLIHGMPPEDHVDTMTPTEKLDFSEDESYEWKEEEELALEDFAAIKIQAHFRGHLARRAFRALRSLVKLQAVVRGMCVRKQMRVAIHFMQAMVRLQVRVRARRLPNNSEERGSSAADGELIPLR